MLVFLGCWKGGDGMGWEGKGREVDVVLRLDVGFGGDVVVGGF